MKSLDAQLRKMSIADLLAAVDTVDELVARIDGAKKTRPPKDVTVARALEARIKALLVEKYAELFDGGTEVAIEAFLQGLRAGDLDAAVDGLVAKYRAALTPLADAVAAPVGQHLSEMYGLGRELALLESGAPAGVSFGLVDEVTLEWLKNDSHFWVLNHVDKDLGELIAKTAREEALRGGQSIEELGETLRALLGEKYGLSESYWETVASSAVNRTRNFARVRGYGAAEIETLEILTMGDDAVCDRCEPMGGRIVSVGKANKRLDALLDDDDPKAVKEYFPWLKDADQAGGISDREMNSGKWLPEFHGKCRCTTAPAG
ncbi:MAG: hypothetical protein PVH29_14525 [Candidatus Zixiibacteriota bacterium]|jgi:hypothetical protein